MAVPVVGLGAGGHAKVVIEILRQDSRYELTGLLDPKPELAGKSVSGVPVVGGDDSLAELKARGTNHFFIGLGSVPHPGPRKRLYLLAREKGLKPVSAIHPKSVIAPSADLGPGATVMAAAVINAEACLGENVIVNTGAIIEHDCRIGDHVHIATGARLAGEVRVGDEAFIGAGAVIRQSINIGRGALVGAGAVVVKDVPESQVVVGNPARPIKR